MGERGPSGTRGWGSPWPRLLCARQGLRVLKSQVGGQHHRSHLPALLPHRPPPGGAGTSETGWPRSEVCSTRGKGSPGQYLCGAVAAPGPTAVLRGVCSTTQDLHTHISPCCSSRSSPVASRAGCGGRSTEGWSGSATAFSAAHPQTPLASAGRGFSNLKSSQLFQIKSQV